MVWLLRKEWRELLVSRAWWMLLVLMGPLVGVSFLSAVRTYAEVSGLNGAATDAGEVLSPLIGVWAPTFSACELAAVFLLPFVAIRIAGADRQSGAAKLELQAPGVSPLARVLAKASIALAGWLLAMLPAVLAIVVWKHYGGATHTPELATLIYGHILNAGITIGIGFAAASVTTHPSTAAILTLSVTVGTWIIHFFAAIQGGLWERVASFTPSAVVADFQHGLLRLDALLAANGIVLAGFAVAAIWQRLGIRPARRVTETAILLSVTAGALVVASHAKPSWDLSENRANSFPVADAEALRSLRHPLTIEVRLAPEDPRRVDLEHNVFSKLRRAVTVDLNIRYVASTTTGLFEQNRPGYGEIWYEYDGHREMSRLTTVEGVLETIYTMAGIRLPADARDVAYRGRPFTASPEGAATLFYGLWPATALLVGFLVHRRFR